MFIHRRFNFIYENLLTEILPMAGHQNYSSSLPDANDVTKGN